MSAVIEVPIMENTVPDEADRNISAYSSGLTRSKDPHITTADEFEHEVVSDQLDSGTLEAERISISAGASTLNSWIFNLQVRHRGTTPQRILSFLYFSRASPGNFFLHHKVDKPGAAFLQPESEIDSISSSEVHMFVFFIPVEVGKKRLIQIESDPAVLDHLQSGAFKPTKESDALGARLSKLYELGKKRGPLDFDSDLEEELFFRFLQSTYGNFDDDKIPPSNYHSIVRKAEDWMRGHIDKPISIGEICDHCRCSRRHLNYAFKDIFDIGPIAYFRSLRLNEAHRMLQTSRPESSSVTDIALDLGFHELGRFSVAYRDLFGESPRETLSKL